MAAEEHLKKSEWKTIYKKIIDSVYQYKPKIYIKQKADAMYWMSTALINNIFVRLAVDDFDVSHNGHTLHIKYRYSSKQEHEKQIAKAEKIILDLINKYENTDCNEFEKTIGIYSYWAGNIKYDYEALKKDKIPSIEDTLFHNKGICQNYSLVMAYTLNQMNIEVYEITGEVNGEAHVWNLVKIYDQYYHLDATFESTGDTMGNGLTFFGLSDKDMSEKENRILDPPYSNPNLKASSKKLKTSLYGVTVGFGLFVALGVGLAVFVLVIGVGLVAVVGLVSGVSDGLPDCKSSSGLIVAGVLSVGAGTGLFVTITFFVGAGLLEGFITLFFFTFTLQTSFFPATFAVILAVPFFFAFTFPFFDTEAIFFLLLFHFTFFFVPFTFKRAICPTYNVIFFLFNFNLAFFAIVISLVPSMDTARVRQSNIAVILFFICNILSYKINFLKRFFLVY